MNNKAILVVEDEPDGAEIVRLILAPARLKTIHFGNAEDALDWLSSNPDAVQAVIIDLALPGMDGMELATRLKGDARFASLPLVAVTAFHTPELRAKMLRQGFDAYFAKPLDTSIFLGSLEKVLA